MRARRGAPELYSHSRLSAFESCPRKFRYRYVDRLPPESESIEGFLGKRVHEVLERLYLFAGRGQVPSLRRVIERFHALWEQEFDAERIRIVREESSADDYRSSGERCLTGYYRRHYPFDGDQTLGLEERVTFSLDADDGYRVQGIIDRVVRARDGAIEIHDYKTARRIPRQEQLDADRQLALYQMGIADRYGPGADIRLVWHYLLAGQQRTSTRSIEQLESLRARTIELIDRIRAEREFEPRPGPLCRWCEYAERCPAGPAARDAGDAPAADVEPDLPEGQLSFF